MQCAKCPWKVSVDPYDIPNGYCPTKHADLSDTIASGTGSMLGPRRMMACHETPPGEELPCVGWLVQQLGPGNNLGLRLAVMAGRVDARVETVGPQHATFEDTLRGGERVRCNKIPWEGSTLRCGKQRGHDGGHRVADAGSNPDDWQTAIWNDEDRTDSSEPGSTRAEEPT